jgi:hypothetical protein
MSPAKVSTIGRAVNDPTKFSLSFWSKISENQLNRNAFLIKEETKIQFFRLLQ